MTLTVDGDPPFPDDPEPRWQAAVAILAVGGLYAALPGSLAVGPRWLAPLVVGALLVPTMAAHHGRRPRVNQLFGHLLAAAMTLFMLWSLALLVLALPRHREAPAVLLRSAAALWVTNVLVFALWYWRLDAGGPHQRDRRGAHDAGAFLFPAMTADGCRLARVERDGRAWSPHFIDYLFLAFNTSTAFSPTDTAVISRWAKALTMLQATISLAVVVILAGRAVNIL